MEEWTVRFALKLLPICAMSVIGKHFVLTAAWNSTVTQHGNATYQLPLPESYSACSSDVSDENDGQHTMSMETCYNCDNLWDSDSSPSPSTSAAFEEASLVTVKVGGEGSSKHAMCLGLQTTIYSQLLRRVGTMASKGLFVRQNMVEMLMSSCLWVFHK